MREMLFPYSLALDRDDDAYRWLVYHGLVVQEISDTRMALHGHSRCAMLITTPDGKTACAVYDDRPEICAGYFCTRALKESE